MAKEKTASGGRSTSNTKKAPARAKSTKPETQTKSAPAKSRARKSTERPTITKRESRFKHMSNGLVSLRRALNDPNFWQQTAQKLPPWADEVGAILLIVLGAVMITALFNTTSEAVLAITLSDGLRQFFGYGAYFIALGVLSLGIMLLLPKFGITIKLGWARIVAIEVMLGAFTALLHLQANDPEPRALASEGGGGGYLGWALSQLTLSLGRLPGILIYSSLFIASFIVVSGLRLRHAAFAIQWINARLQRTIASLDAMTFDPPPPEPERVSQPVDVPEAVVNSPESAQMPYSRPSIVPRTAQAAEGDPPQKNKPEAAPVQARPVHPRVHKLTKEEKQELVNKTRTTLGAANGRSLVAPGEPGERSSIVPRALLPDFQSGSITRMQRHNYDSDRYFTVDDFQEIKKVGKRDEALPALNLLSDIELNKPTEDEINTNARIIKNTLLEFDVETEVIDVRVGPTVTQYAVSPYTASVNTEGETVLNRVRVSQIANLAGDLALALSAKRLRIQAPVPGHSYVGVEVPNRQPSTVALRPVLESESFYKKRTKPLALPLGRDVSGEPFIADLASMPHLLIAGTTGSGKSIMLASMTTAFVMNNSPDRLRLVLLDPKMVELSRFNGLPHLLGPVETELDRIIGVLRWATREMDHRYKLLEKEAARNIEAYNTGLGRRRKHEQLPYLVIIIDEIGDLMMQRPDETERALTRLAQMARAVGIHLMVATQRPSVDVITGLIKANFPARVSFAVASGTDSRVILDHNGAETLMGRGDMLFLAPDAAGPQRIQGCYVSDEEVNAVVDYWADWHETEIEAETIEPPSVAPWERGMTRREVLAETDPMLEDAIALVIAEGEASASLIQRRLGLGYPRAARIVDLMQEIGVVGGPRPGGRSREVLVKPGSDPFKKLIDKRLKSKK